MRDFDLHGSLFQMSEWLERPDINQMILVIKSLHKVANQMLKSGMQTPLQKSYQTVHLHHGHIEVLAMSHFLNVTPFLINNKRLFGFLFRFYFRI